VKTAQADTDSALMFADEHEYRISALLRVFIPHLMSGVRDYDSLPQRQERLKLRIN
jgi:hypothetical protein